MRSVEFICLAVIFAGPGCALFQAPKEVQILTPVAGSEIKHYEKKMGGVAIDTTTAYETSETRRLKDIHNRAMVDFYKAFPAKFTPLYVRAQYAIHMGKLAKVHGSTEDVKRRIAEINIHIDRAVQILELVSEWMKTGFDKDDAQAVVRFFEENSEKWLKLERDKALVQLDEEVRKLTSELEAKAEEEKAAEEPPAAEAPVVPPGDGSGS